MITTTYGTRHTASSPRIPGTTLARYPAAAHPPRPHTRTVIKTLMAITLHSPGKGARREFDPATVKITWLHNN